MPQVTFTCVFVSTVVLIACLSAASTTLLFALNARTNWEAAESQESFSTMAAVRANLQFPLQRIEWWTESKFMFIFKEPPADEGGNPFETIRLDFIKMLSNGPVFTGCCLFQYNATGDEVQAMHCATNQSVQSGSGVAEPTMIQMGLFNASVYSAPLNKYLRPQWSSGWYAAPLNAYEFHSRNLLPNRTVLWLAPYWFNPSLPDTRASHVQIRLVSRQVDPRTKKEWAFVHWMNLDDAWSSALSAALPKKQQESSMSTAFILDNDGHIIAHYGGLDVHRRTQYLCKDHPDHTIAAAVCRLIGDELLKFASTKQASSGLDIDSSQTYSTKVTVDGSQVVVRAVLVAYSISDNPPAILVTVSPRSLFKFTSTSGALSAVAASSVILCVSSILALLGVQVIRPMTRSAVSMRRLAAVLRYETQKLESGEKVPPHPSVFASASPAMAFSLPDSLRLLHESGPLPQKQSNTRFFGAPLVPQGALGDRSWIGRRSASVAAAVAPGCLLHSTDSSSEHSSTVQANSGSTATIAVPLGPNAQVTQPEQTQHSRTKRGHKLSHVKELRQMQHAFQDMVYAIDQHAVQLRRAREQAERSTRVQADFLANMSHEIRTPLNGVLAGIELVLGFPLLTADQQELVQAMASSAQHLTVLLNDILDTTKLDAGAMELERRPLCLEVETKGVMAMLRNRASAKNLDFGVTLDEGVPPVVLGDALRLRQVLCNLLSNAIKFTPVGGRVWCSVRQAKISSSPFAAAFLRGEQALQTPSAPTPIVPPLPSATACSTSRTAPPSVATNRSCMHSERSSSTHVNIPKSESGDEEEPVSTPALRPPLGRQWSTVGLTSATALSFKKERRHSSGPTVAAASHGAGFADIGGLPSEDELSLNLRTHVIESSSNGFVEIVVEDSGIGMTEDVVARLFDRFHQADASTTREHGGSGLGLSITKGLLDLMGGRVHVVSTAGSGTTFYVYIPFTEPEPALTAAAVTEAALDDVLGRSASVTLVGPLSAGHPQTPQSQETEGDDRRTSASSGAVVGGIPPFIPAGHRASTQLVAQGWTLRVLVVEDHPVNQLVVARLLERMGFSCQITDNGQKGLEAYQSHCRQRIASHRCSDHSSDNEADTRFVTPAQDEEIDVILMDLQMPVLDGYAAARAIRAFERTLPQTHTRRVPIIALTAHALKADKDMCLAAGMDDYITKPIAAQALFAALERVHRHKLRNCVVAQPSQLAPATLSQSVSSPSFHHISLQRAVASQPFRPQSPTRSPTTLLLGQRLAKSNSFGTNPLSLPLDKEKDKDKERERERLERDREITASRPPRPVRNDSWVSEVQPASSLPRPFLPGNRSALTTHFTSATSFLSIAPLPLQHNE
eukprot:TRINITY_DN6536_c0_g1_i1.p1 TRINITY_DN6536_c0_g1~~TRINITY_DN6536_c0_g1_i1.p1  ORF type:complete len:1358 (+),score=166.28 TRINITY_DN6536_c0_g1_i1:40-4113(+)